MEPSGRKTFVARYRAGGGRSGVLRQATIGRYGTVTVDEARTRARKLLGAAAGGGDPIGERKRSRQTGLTIAEVCDWYLEQATSGRLLGRGHRPIKASTLLADRSRIECRVKPFIGRRPVSVLTPRDFEELQADVAVHRTPRGSSASGHGTGARVLAMMSAILGHARRAGLIAGNPALGARKFAAGRRKARLSVEQLRSLGQAMREAGAHPTGVAAIRLIALTGLRRGEALGLRPEWLLPAGGIDFPDTKAGPQVRPIGGAAVELIKSRANGEWTFPADRGEGYFKSLPAALARVCEAAGLAGVTAHTLRHTYASVAAEIGYSELVVAGLLGHGSSSVTAGYVHIDAALVSAADRVSAVIADALDGKPAAMVIPLREGAG